MERKVMYNETVHKYTVNVPKAKLDGLRAKARACGIHCLSVYVNAMIDRELTIETGFSVQEVALLRNQTFRIASAERRAQERHEGKKKMGFIKLSIRRISNIINPNQQFFNFSIDRQKNIL